MPAPTPPRIRKDSEEWGYIDKSSWKGTCKTGKRQSPIDLDIGDAIVVNWEPLKFHNYDVRGEIVAENNGHTGGNLKGKYYLQQFHFHWDGNDRFGSEHTLNGLHYPMEVHFVHIREGLNETTAPQSVGGIAVVGVQFQLAVQGEALFDLEKVTEATNSSGSLTTPPCSEGVIWSILSHPNFATNNQIRSLRRYLKEDGSLLIDNWRSVQPMNGRKLYLNKGIVKEEALDAAEVLEITSKVIPVILVFGVVLFAVL
ncbi:unnamed protein product [Cylicocyclus nassatus]|uniref:Carbonic anhydrase n=1 Tax=Cylicocyclus nassatus TaxID=53992 RepID=A0AA36DTL5_CYLNA|nr:unnamed protein product [Cylicocyclus nassatus]